MPAKSKKARRVVDRPARAKGRQPYWPSEAEQTLEALRGGLIDALVLPDATGQQVYALRTFEELERANAELLQAQERLLMLLSERERLMQDLHDGCIQSIYAVGLALEDCRRLVRKDPAGTVRNIGRAEANLNLVIQELRAFIAADGNDAPIDLGREIAATVEALGGHGPAFVVRINSALAKSLSRECAAQLLQIAREGVSNVVQHANASSARIALRRRGRQAELEVVDNGTGFDANTDKAPGLGLHHIAARTQKLGGALTLTSKRAKGTRLAITIPLD